MKKEAKAIPAFIIAGTASGAGKTLLTLGIIEALKRRGIVVQAFKAGPDYIDPGLHKRLLGRPSYNLDTWMMGVKAVKKTFHSASQGADCAVIEGVMGLFDGVDGKSEEGSTAHLSKTLKIPVLLVADSRKAARSMGAVIKGFESFDPRVDIRWVVFNKVGSLRHFNILKDSIPRPSKIKALGYIPREEGLELDERHLGLKQAAEISAKGWDAFVKKAGDLISGSIDIERLLKESRVSLKMVKHPASLKLNARIAVASDRAFSFYYQENLDMLRRLGAEIVFFSPLSDKRLPEGTEGVYIGGGYPELNSKALQINASMRKEVRQAAAKGMPIYAECGGLMYLGRSIEMAGRQYAMAGVFPWNAKLLAKRKALGYREVTLTGKCPFKCRGTLKGHEFHYSEISASGLEGAYRVKGAGRVFKEGFVFRNTLASYIHLHFASNPGFAESFLKSAVKSRKK